MGQVNLSWFHGLLFLPSFLPSSGLRDHDVIVSINGQPVTTTADVIEAVKDNDSLSIIVHRGSQTLFLTVTPEIIS
jgi:S1-C subfamily serine protease